MKQESRSKKVIKNISISIIYQIVNLIFNFILRTIFIKTLGVEILGVNGLFSNILSVLSLTDLGINTAMLYSLYNPLYNKEENKISALLNYYKKIYNIIAFIIFTLGIFTVPLLKYIVNTNLNINDIILYYILYLINSVSSYFVVYKTCVVIADQKEYKLKIIDIVALIIKFIVQTFILIWYQNYILYLLSQIFITIITNIAKSNLSSKHFKIDKKQKISTNDKKSIWNNVKSLFIYQIGNVIMNNTDNILISIILGTTIVGYYSNYLMIIGAINSVVGMIFSSLQASMGNFNIESSNDQKYKMYKLIIAVSDFIFGFGSIALICLLNHFISIWLGKSFTFDKITVIIIGLNFYVTGLLYPSSSYRFTTELFNRAKYAMLASAIMNLILSVILGKLIGLNGILLATLISRLITTFWYDALILYREYFNVKFIEFFKIEIKNFIFFFIVFIITFFLTNIFKDINIKIFVIQILIVCICTIGSYFLKYRKSEELKFLLLKFKMLVKR